MELKSRDLKSRYAISLLFVLMAAAGGMLFLSSGAARESYPLDDAWIHMVYARHLVEGHGFSYNPPAQEAGFTSPLWLLLSALSRLITEQVLLPKTIGLVFLVLLGLVARRLGGLAAGLLILLDPLHYFAALSGMEVILFAFLSVLSLERLFQGKSLQAGLAAAGALWSRPEGAVLIPILLLLGVERRSERKELFTKIGRLVLPSIAAALIWIAFCLAVTGRPFPNTFYAKLASPAGSIGFFDLLYRLLADSGSTLPFVAPLLLLAAIVKRRDRHTTAALLYASILLLGVYATRPILLVEGFYWERYLIPALPGIYILMGIGLQSFWSAGTPGKVLAVTAWLCVAAGLCFQFENKKDLYTKNCNDIARYNVAAGRWILENTDPDERVAVMDAGALRYFGNRTIIDLAGLNDQRFTDITELAKKVDVADAAALADYSGAEWLVLYQRHFSGRRGFTLFHRITYSDCSLYVRPEGFTLLFLRKDQH